MTIDDKIRDEKLQHDIKKEARRISTLSSGKVNKRNSTVWPETNNITS